MWPNFGNCSISEIKKKKIFPDFESSNIIFLKSESRLSKKVVLITSLENAFYFVLKAFVMTCHVEKRTSLESLG